MKKYFITFFLLLFIFNSFSQSRSETFQLILKDNWKMQSAVKDPSPAQKIAQEQFNTKNWYNVSVPSTIIGGLLANKVYNFDPFYGQNLEKLNAPELDKPWWFRKEFTLPSTENGKNVILQLHGINYKANVWLNGVKIADSTQTKGPFRILHLDITKHVHYNGNNVLALEILRPFNPNKKDGDLAVDYADWIHYPPDYNGGILNNVTVRTYDKVGVQYPLVSTKFDLPNLSIAHLTVDAQVTNYTNEPQDATVRGRINENVSFEKKVHLLAHESKDVTFTPTDFPQLNIKNPRIWWPWQYGKPELNRVELALVINSRTSNTISEDFGIREMTSKLIDNRSRVFLVNGKRIMIRGAAWSPDIFQRRSPERQEQEVKLVRDMNMNLIRSEGKLEDDNFYDLCDKYGMLVMSGWMCCGTWQYPENWDPTERKVAMGSDSSVMYWLRNKASLMVWLNGSDMPPTDTTVERDYLKIEKDLKWPNPTIATADASKSKVSGYSGVKMAGPYEWVPPVYWETDTNKKYGGTWSFATEISPGPSIPPYESLIKFIPKDSLNNTSADWLYHCGTMEFGKTTIFNKALDGRYGKSSSIKTFVAKAQAQNYEAHRAMMEAYGLNKYHTATGVVQWMLSNPWPSLIWHTYDYYLYPAGTYFGMKKSMEPLHIMYSYRSHEVALINSYLKEFSGLQVTAEVFNSDGKLMFRKTIAASVSADSVKRCFAIPAIAKLSEVYFIRLELKDKQKNVRSLNWYWLSKENDVLNWKKSTWFYTPQSAYTNFSGLQSLPKTTIKATYNKLQKGDSTQYDLTLTNTGKAVAFFVHVRAISKKTNDDILPVIFSDNYICLAPGETRKVRCSYGHHEASFLEISSWNMDEKTTKSTADVKYVTGLPLQ